MTDDTPRTVNETAVALGVSRRTVYSMMERGELQWVQVGGRRKVPAGEIERLTGSLDPVGGEAA